MEGTGTKHVSVDISALIPGETYQYRVVGFNSLGTSIGFTETFVASEAPTFANTFVNEVKTDGALMNSLVNPNGLETQYYFEYGPDDTYGSRAPLTNRRVAAGTNPVGVTVQVSGLIPGEEYHYRVAAFNTRGINYGPDKAFRTYDRKAVVIDPCANALARKQTGAAFLLDCRAYELVSAADTGGYNVESDLVAGQEPFARLPLRRTDRGPLRDPLGAIPASATRPTAAPTPTSRPAATGWTTAVRRDPRRRDPDRRRRSPRPWPKPTPASPPSPSPAPTSATPCFADGKTGTPGAPAERRAGPGDGGVDRPGPGADADGLVRKRFSADGRHLVFGSTSQFEADGPTAAQPAIYDRDLVGRTPPRSSPRLPAAATSPASRAARRGASPSSTSPPTAPGS